MKRLPILAAFTVAAFTLPTGCEKPQEQVEPSVSESVFTITATIEQPTDSPDTKTSLGPKDVGAATTPVYWSNGDKIKLFSGTSYATGSIMATTSETAWGEFTLEDSEPTPEASGPYYAFYPYTTSSAPTIAGDGKITATLGNQSYAEDSFGANAAPMVAYAASGTNLTFKNVFGLLKLTLNQTSGVSVSAIRVTSSAGEYLSGKATIDYNSGNPTVTFDAANNRSHSVTLTCPTPVSLNDAAKIFYIAVPPVSSGGYEVKVYTSDGRLMTRTIPDLDDNDIVCSRILNMPAIGFTADGTVTDLSASGTTANCYIAAPGGQYVFTMAQGNLGWSLGTVASVKVLWNTGTSAAEVIPGIKVDISTSTVSFSTNNPGNAVIAAYDTEDPDADEANILWSWHIWVTDYNPSRTYVTYNSSMPTPYTIMMDRNLGAMNATPGDVGAMGLLYQWGRKDPFIGSAVSFNATDNNANYATTTGTWDTETATNAVNGGTNALDYSIKHPMTFITSISSFPDWYCTDANNMKDNLWSSSKTIYDPCPFGWRIPTGGSNGGVWYDLDVNQKTWDNNGMTFTAPNTWYPAVGLRHRVAGTLFNVGNLGCYWSHSVPSPVSSSGSPSANAYILRFNHTQASHSTAERANGFSVRCCKES